jgi:hypothetical protein
MEGERSRYAMGWSNALSISAAHVRHAALGKHAGPSGSKLL